MIKTSMFYTLCVFTLFSHLRFNSQPAFINLKTRLTSTVTNYLDGLKWAPEMQRNVVRDRMRNVIIK